MVGAESTPPTPITHRAGRPNTYLCRNGRSRSCIRKENHFQLILQHAAYHQIKGFDFAYNYKTTFDFLYM